MPITIRTAQPEDLPLLLELSSALIEREKNLFDEALISNWSGTRSGKAYYRSRCKAQGGCALLAFDEQVCIGYLTGGIMDREVFRKPFLMAELEETFIVDSHRGKGVGKLLYAAFERWCREKEVQRIRVEAYANNQAAVHFYEQLGFSKYALVLEQELPQKP